MGRVDRARDTRLGRAVAIKIVSPTLAVDPDRLYRFEQEARSAAALNHPVAWRSIVAPTKSLNTSEMAGRCLDLNGVCNNHVPDRSQTVDSKDGEMSEWLKEHAWKACVGETLPWVRIPLSPPFANSRRWSLPIAVSCGHLRVAPQRVRVRTPTLERRSSSYGARSGEAVVMVPRDPPPSSPSRHAAAFGYRGASSLGDGEVEYARASRDLRDENDLPMQMWA